MDKAIVFWIYGLGAYALALIGAWGFSWAIKLDFRVTLIVVGAAAVIAFFGTLLPILRLGYARRAVRRAKRQGIHE